MIEETDDDVPQLSTDTLAALQEFLLEQSVKKDNCIEENWQLSQFWYDEETTQILSQAAASHCCNNGSIALISCPTLYNSVKSKIVSSNEPLNVKLFEFDQRFSSFGPDFVFYDYNNPLNLDSDYKNYFDIVVADPPFLSEECLQKVSETIKYLLKAGGKIILCTGAVMEPLANDLLNLKKCDFQPRHKNNLANEFICLTNFGDIS